MLVGREPELARIRELLDGVRGARSGVLVVHGDPGMGKSALLEQAIEGADGVRVLTARGVESEAVLAFAGLQQLLYPLRSALDRVGDEQAELLRAVLAGGPRGDAAGRFAVGAASLALLAAAAEESPLLLVVDDAHWLDRASGQALAFAARRLQADRVAMLVAERDAEGSAFSDFPALRLEGLGPAEIAQLMARRDGRSPDRAVVAGVAASTGGNPLAVLELEPLAPGPAPPPTSERLAAAFLRRGETLAAGPRTGLTLVAAYEGEDAGTILAVGAALGIATADFEAAEGCGLLELTPGRIAFAHPLARSAWYHAAARAERRACHRALADVVGEDARAWHLAAAAMGADGEAARLLTETAERASRRGAYAVAASACERAAELTPDRDQRAGRLVEAAWSARLAGQPEDTARLAAAARTAGPAGIAEVRLASVEGGVAVEAGDPGGGLAVLESAADQAVALDRGFAVRILAEASWLADMTVGDPSVVRRLSSAAVAAARGLESEHAAFLSTAAEGFALVASGEDDAGVECVREAVALFEGSDSLRQDSSLLGWAALLPLYLREADGGDDLRRWVSERSGAVGAAGVRPLTLLSQAREAATCDRWALASVLYDEGVRLARQTGQSALLAWGVAAAAAHAARRGEVDASSALIAEATTLADRYGLAAVQHWIEAARSDLALGLGRLEEARASLSRRQELLADIGLTDPDLSAVPELVQTLIRLGRVGEAVALAPAYAAAAEAKGQPWALARLGRTNGLLASELLFEGEFEEALTLHARTPDAFERAVTELAFGERLRRARRRVDARVHLRSAVDIFANLGARDWHARAVAELRATGARAPGRRPSPLDELTPQELTVASLLATGVTTRQAASTLFLSPKTVEYHLRHAYRKLGVGSRSELAQLLGSAFGQPPID